MKNPQLTAIEIVQAREVSTKANATLGSYGMDSYCPLHVIKCYRVVFEDTDLDRLFTLAEFAKHTLGGTAKLRDIDPATAKMDRVASFSKVDSVDLRTHDELEPIYVGRALESGPIVASDGNHRMIAQFLNHKSIDGVTAFVCIHPNMGQWKMMPLAARV